MPSDPPAPAAAHQPRDGSALYYSLLPLDPNTRLSAYNLLKLVQVLADALVDVQEPKVADQKIHWWHEEISRLFEDEPRHPATRGCQITLNSMTEPARVRAQSHLMTILSVNSNEKYQNNQNQQQFIERIRQDFSARLSLLLELSGLADAKESEIASGPQRAENAVVHPQLEAYATGLGIFDRLRHCHRLRHQSYEVWPDSAYREHGLQPADLGQTNKIEETHALIGAFIEQALAQLTEALSQQSVPDKALGKASLPIYINASLRQKQLKLWQKKHVNPMQQYVALTPLHKAWHAMRCRQRFSSHN